MFIFYYFCIVILSLFQDIELYLFLEVQNEHIIFESFAIFLEVYLIEYLLLSFYHKLQYILIVLLISLIYFTGT